MKRTDRVYIADSSPLFRQGVRQMLYQAGCEVAVYEADSLSNLNRLVKRFAVRRPLSQSLLLCEARLKGLKTFDQLVSMGQEYQLRVLLISEGLDHAFPDKAKRQGIHGVIDKTASPECFLDAFRAAQEGREWYADVSKSDVRFSSNLELSRMQREVLKLLQTGLSNKQIAWRLDIAMSTVTHHVSQIYRKLGFDAPNRTLLAVEALRWQL